MNRRLLVVVAVAAVAVLGIGGAVAVGSFGDTQPSTAATVQDDHDDHGGGDAGGGGMDHDGMDHGDAEMDMQMVENGTIVNGNAEELPPGCDEVAGEREVTVRGGVTYSEGGEMFAFDREELAVEQCTRLSVTFVNEDEVRHQWMIHGLPGETYPMGMFNIEVDGPGSVTGTLVTPAEDVTLHTHCSMPQHEQKGMVMSLVVGDGGDGGMDHGDSGGDGGGHDH